MNRQEITDLLRAAQANCPAPGSPGPETVGVPHVLAELAGAWPGPLTGEHRASIDALCRKLAVTGGVSAEYNRDWTKRTNEQPLAASHWLLLLAVLLAWSETPEAMGPDGRGLALKCLNAALTAHDRIKSMNGAEVKRPCASVGCRSKQTAARAEARGSLTSHNRSLTSHNRSLTSQDRAGGHGACEPGIVTRLESWIDDRLARVSCEVGQ